MSQNSFHRNSGDQRTNLSSSLRSDWDITAAPTVLLRPKIGIKTKGKIVFSDPSLLISIVARGNQVVIRHRSGTYVCRETLTSLESNLRPYGFVRIHRSTLVNSAWVSEIRPDIRGDYRLILRNGSELKASNSYKAELSGLSFMWV